MIKEIVVANSGYLNCKSCFYTSHDTLQEQDVFRFTIGINQLIGDIDSGIWGISYLLSMYNIDICKKMLFNPPIAMVNGEEIFLESLTNSCCYLDHTAYPLFSSKRKTVRQLIKKGIKKSGSKLNVEEIIDMFSLDSSRVDRPINCVGNERFRAMAAIGYAYGKQIFCFPWLSKKMFDYYTNNILYLLDVLEKCGMIVILPVGR